MKLSDEDPVNKRLLIQPHLNVNSKGCTSQGTPFVLMGPDRISIFATNVKEMKMRKYNLHPSGIRSDQSSIVVAAKRRPWLGGLRLRGWQ